MENPQEKLSTGLAALCEKHGMEIHRPDVTQKLLEVVFPYKADSTDIAITHALHRLDSLAQVDPRLSELVYKNLPALYLLSLPQVEHWFDHGISLAHSGQNVTSYFALVPGFEGSTKYAALVQEQLLRAEALTSRLRKNSQKTVALRTHLGRSSSNKSVAVVGSLCLAAFLGVTTAIYWDKSNDIAEQLRTESYAEEVLDPSVAAATANHVFASSIDTLLSLIGEYEMHADAEGEGSAHHVFQQTIEVLRTSLISNLVGYTTALEEARLRMNNLEAVNAELATQRETYESTLAQTQERLTSRIAELEVENSHVTTNGSEQAAELQQLYATQAVIEGVDAARHASLHALLDVYHLQLGTAETALDELRRERDTMQTLVSRIEDYSTELEFELSHAEAQSLTDQMELLRQHLLNMALRTTSNVQYQEVLSASDDLLVSAAQLAAGETALTGAQEVIAALEMNSDEHSAAYALLEDLNTTLQGENTDYLLRVLSTMAELTALQTTLQTYQAREREVESQLTDLRGQNDELSRDNAALDATAISYERDFQDVSRELAATAVDVGRLHVDAAMNASAYALVSQAAREGPLYGRLLGMGEDGGALRNALDEFVVAIGGQVISIREFTASGGVSGSPACDQFVAGQLYDQMVFGGTDLDPSARKTFVDNVDASGLCGSGDRAGEYIRLAPETE
jgi:hypothetical protein